MRGGSTSTGFGVAFTGAALPVDADVVGIDPRRLDAMDGLGTVGAPLFQRVAVELAGTIGIRTRRRRRAAGRRDGERRTGSSST